MGAGAPECSSAPAGGGEREATPERNGGPEESGTRWGCLSLHRSSRLAVAFCAKSSEAEAVPEVVRQTRERTAGQRGILWISDGHHAYVKAVRKTYRHRVRTRAPGRPRFAPTPGVGLTQIVKTRKQNRLEKVEVRHRFGPKPTSPYTVLVERKNGVLRDRLACLTRKTHAFAKRDATWLALVGLSLFEHNWLIEHKKLRERATDLPGGRIYRRRSPAMAAGMASV